MSKIISVTDDMIESVISEFSESIRKFRSSDGKISYIKDFTPSEVKNSKATVHFTPIAFSKTIKLIECNSDEVGWHGMSRKIQKGEYEVYDIIVYPQTVTGATVKTDQSEYDQWMINLDDKIYNNLFFHGHSHVNMACTPSGVDTTEQKSWLNALKDDGFYIFFIGNKKNDTWMSVYDMGDNIVYENSDITIDVRQVSDWVSESKSLVKKELPASASKTYSVYSGGSKKDVKTQSSQQYSSWSWHDDGWYQRTTKLFDNDCNKDAGDEDSVRRFTEDGLIEALGVFGEDEYE